MSTSTSDVPQDKGKGKQRAEDSNQAGHENSSTAPVTPQARAIFKGLMEGSFTLVLQRQTLARLKRCSLHSCLISAIQEEDPSDSIKGPWRLHLSCPGNVSHYFHPSCFVSLRLDIPRFLKAQPPGHSLETFPKVEVTTFTNHKKYLDIRPIILDWIDWGGHSFERKQYRPYIKRYETWVDQKVLHASLKKSTPFTMPRPISTGVIRTKVTHRSLVEVLLEYEGAASLLPLDRKKQLEFLELEDGIDMMMKEIDLKNSQKTREKSPEESKA